MLYKKRIFQIVLGVIWIAGMVISYMSKQNEVTAARVEIPKLSAEIKAMNEEICGLQFEVDALENPVRLLELAKQSEFSHLKFPKDCHIVKANETLLQPKDSQQTVKSPFALGAIQ